MGYHNKRERRRDIQLFRYEHTPCPFVYDKILNGGQWLSPKLCPKGVFCNYAHSWTEEKYHPQCYKTAPCFYSKQNCRKVSTKNDYINLFGYCDDAKTQYIGCYNKLAYYLPFQQNIVRIGVVNNFKLYGLDACNNAHSRHEQRYPYEKILYIPPYKIPDEDEDYGAGVESD